MREKTFTIYKNEGETPLECLDRFRLENPLYEDSILSYAGRLDPMAEGILLVVVDEENKDRQKYLGLDKVYEVEVLFGISTDTGDILGIPAYAARTTPVGNMESVLRSFVGPFIQKYPHYSSKTVSGKPLFKWAREGRLDEIEIPERTSEIYSIELLEMSLKKGGELHDEIVLRVARIRGDFRQEAILAAWSTLLKERLNEAFIIVKIRVSCSSGTYMRTLAEEIGKKSGQSALAWRIVRTEIRR